MTVTIQHPNLVNGTKTLERLPLNAAECRGITNTREDYFYLTVYIDGVSIILGVGKEGIINSTSDSKEKQKTIKDMIDKEKLRRLMEGL